MSVLKISIDQVSVKKVKGRWRVTPDSTLEDYLYTLIKNRGPMTRGQLNELTNIPRTTLYDYLIKFIKDKTIEKFPVGNKRRGRPLIFYRILDKVEKLP